MMKKMRMAVVMLLGLLMTGCSTSKIDGIAVGNVSNSECLQKGRTRGDSDRSWAPKLILTRDGDNIVGEIRNYEVNCGHRDLIVTCKQDGSELTITVKEEVPKEDGDISRTSCLCPVNIYFTIYDIEGDLFHVNLEGNDYGNVSFKEGNRVELTVIAAQAPYGRWQVLGYGSDDNFTAKENNWTEHCFLILKEDGSLEGWIDNDFVGSYTYKENGEFSVTNCRGSKVLSTNLHIVFMEEQVCNRKIQSYKLLDNELRLFYSESEYLMFRKE